MILDLDSKQRRPGTIEDFGKIAKVVDSLENIHFFFAGVGYVKDVPQEVVQPYKCAAAVRNCTKAIHGGSYGFSAKWYIEIAKAVGVGLLGINSVAPPLTVEEEACDGIIRFSEGGYGQAVFTGGMSGATAPSTIAGTILQNNIEQLGCIVLTQAVKPGVGYMYGCNSIPLDMRTGDPSIGIMGYMIGTTMTQMAGFYNIPSCSFTSFTNGKIPADQQVGYEKGISLLSQALSGTTLIAGAGGIENQACFSFEQLLIDNEVFGMIGKFIDGTIVDEETLAVDLIKKVGPIPGNYLGEKHTVNMWKNDHFLPELGYWKNYDEWIHEGSKDIVERANERAKEIIDNHVVEPLPEDVDKEITKILKAAEREMIK